MKDNGEINCLSFDFEILRRKKVVCEEVKCFPFTSPDYTFMANDMVIAICLNGEMNNLYDTRPVTFRKHDISVMLPDHFVSGGTYTDDYKALLIVVSRELYYELIHHNSFCDFYKYRYRPCFHPNDEQYEKITAILKVLQIIVESEHPKRLDMAIEIFDVFFYILSQYRDEEKDKEENVAGNGILFQRFYDLLFANHKKEHMVTWYADKLCLTPKYFSTVIKKTTGKSAGEWISIVLALKAKTLLDSYQELTVTEIADLLGFSSNASFCRFFRRMNGMSPTEYRG